MNKKELPPLHKDMYYFGYGIDIEKPIEMANIIIELQQENKILKENAKNNDKVADKVNWENMLLKKENKQLQERIEYLERSNNRREDTILEQRQEISDLEDEIKFYKNRDTYIVVDILGSYDLNDINLKLLEGILQKYKEIIGVSDEKEN